MSRSPSRTPYPYRKDLDETFFPFVEKSNVMFVSHAVPHGMYFVTYPFEARPNQVADLVYKEKEIKGSFYNKAYALRVFKDSNTGKYYLATDDGTRSKDYDHLYEAVHKGIAEMTGSDDYHPMSITVKSVKEIPERSF